MFTKIGRIVGFLAVILGFGGIIGSFVVAPDMMSPEFTRMSLEQSSLWLSQGALLVFCGLSLGVLCEISAKLDR